MTYSRRSFFALAAGGVLFGFSSLAAESPIIVEESGNLVDALMRSGRTTLGFWPIDGRTYPYVAAFDGLALPLRGSARAFSIAHNGVFVTEALSSRRVNPGDKISVAVF